MNNNQVLDVIKELLTQASDHTFYLELDKFTYGETLANKIEDCVRVLEVDRLRLERVGLLYEKSSKDVIIDEANIER